MSLKLKSNRHIILDKLSVSLDEPEQQALAPIFVNSVFSHDLKSFVARPHYADALEKGFSISKQMLLYGLGGVGCVTPRPRLDSRYKVPNEADIENLKSQSAMLRSFIWLTLPCLLSGYIPVQDRRS